MEFGTKDHLKRCLQSFFENVSVLPENDVEFATNQCKRFWKHFYLNSSAFKLSHEEAALATLFHLEIMWNMKQTEA